MNIEEIKKEQQRMIKQISKLQGDNYRLMKAIEQKEAEQKEPEWVWPLVEDEKFWCISPSSNLLYECFDEDNEYYKDIMRYGTWFRTEEEAERYVKVYKALMDLKMEVVDDYDFRSYIRSNQAGDEWQLASCVGWDTNNLIVFGLSSVELKIKINEYIHAEKITDKELAWFLSYEPERPRRVK